MVRYLTSSFVRRVRRKRGGATAKRQMAFEHLDKRCLMAVDLAPLLDINVHRDDLIMPPQESLVMGSTLYFTMRTPNLGVELWKSDGTSEGTTLVKDLLPGASGSYPSWLTELNGMLFFGARSVNEQVELWKSDGTSDGTVLVRDVAIGGTSQVTSLVNVNGTLYFGNNDGVHGQELWKTDGTSSGTSMVKDLNSGFHGSGLALLTNVGGTLYFSASDGIRGFEPWKSDGTESGTSILRDISNNSSNPRDFTAVGSTLYFLATNSNNGEELWKSDGTRNGTVLVRDILPGTISSNISELTNLNGVLLFVANNDSSGTELWRSEGTSATTVVVRELAPGGVGSNPGSLTVANGFLYFQAMGSFWKSDGTSAGTTQIKSDVAPQKIQVVNDALFFAAHSPNHGTELWKSDGTAIGTFMVSDIRPGSDSSMPIYLNNVNGKLLFRANDGIHKSSMWISDGSTEGTTRLRNFVGTRNANPARLLTIDGIAYFEATDIAHGNELWRSDGTSAGTRMVRDIRQGYFGSAISHLTNVNGTLFFLATTPTTAGNLWKSDGTTQGTVPVESAATPDGNMVNLNGLLYFIDSNATTGFEIWKSDGTASGTTLVKTLGKNTNPGGLMVVGNTMYFAASSNLGQELWKSDGTSQGTMMVKDIAAGTYSSFPNSMTNIGGTLYFLASEGPGLDPLLWKSNGTVEGTNRLIDIPVAGSSSVNWLTTIGDLHFFSGHNSTNGWELYKTDGTQAGTSLVRDIATFPNNAESSFPQHPTEVLGNLLFFADDGIHGRELWRSSGTSDSTVLVKDIYPGKSASREPTDGPIVVFNDLAYFVAKNSYANYELWVSDGTSAGTRRVVDFTADDGGATPTIIGTSSTRLIVSASTDSHGRELYAFGIDLSRSSIPEGMPIGSEVGRLTAFGQAAGTFTYSLVNGAESTDNSSFTIDGNGVLRSAKSFQFATQSRYTIRVRVTNESGGYFEQPFSVTIDDPSTTQLDIALNASPIFENVTVGTPVGNLETSGLNSTFAYTFVSGDGDADNSKFRLSGSSLLVNSTMDFELKSSYSVRIRSTAANQVFKEETFTLQVVDQPEGTSGDDLFTVRLGSGGISVQLGSSDLGIFPPDRPLTFYGLGGNDTINFLGSTSNDRVTLTSNGVGYRNQELLLNGIEDVAIRLGEGDDTFQVDARPSSIQTLTLIGGAGDDQYRFHPQTNLGVLRIDESNDGYDTLDFTQDTSGVRVDLRHSGTQVVSPNLQLTLLPGSTFEQLVGGAGNDILIGDALDNRLIGNAGNDSLSGGAGNDSYTINMDSPQGSDTLSDSSGYDTIDFSVTNNLGAQVNLSLSTPQVVSTNYTLTLSNPNSFERLVGTELSDTLRGNLRANRLEGLGGDDILEGGLGNDVYVFNADSNLGLDTLADSDGVDLLDFSQTANRGIRINLGITTPQVVTLLHSIRLASSSSFESVIGSRLHDTIVGNQLANTFIGHQGDDSFSGGDGDDRYLFDTSNALGSDSISDSGGIDLISFSLTMVGQGIAFNLGSTLTQKVNNNLSLTLDSGTAIENLTGSGLDDFLVGNSLANTLVGGLGADSLDGKSGNDLYVFDGDLALGSDNIWDSSGIDTISFASTSSKEVTIDLGLSVSQGITRTFALEISSGTLIENVIGGRARNNLKGNNLANLLVGGSARDVLDGRDGLDVLIGRGGADQMLGGNQDDLLIAGTTIFDANHAALNSILLEWSSSRPYATRVSNLRGGVGGLPSLLKTTNVHRDLVANQISGGLGQDWFFADLVQGTDTITDSEGNESTDEL